MGAIDEPASASDIVAYGQRHRWVVMGLPGAGVRLRGEAQSDIGHTFFLIAFLILIVASILLGQILIRRRWSPGGSLGRSFPVAGRTARNRVPGTRRRVVTGDRSRLLVSAECPVRNRQSAPRSIRPTR